MNILHCLQMILIWKIAMSYYKICHHSSIFPNDIPEFSPTPDNKHFTEEPSNNIGTCYLLTLHRHNFEPNIKENPSTSNYYEKSDDDTPMPSPYIDFCASPICVDVLYLDNSVATPATQVNDTDSPVSTPTFQRHRCLKDWKDDVRKRNVNRGLHYISRNGKVHNKKLLKPSCPTTSKIVKTFWDIGHHSRQWDFLTKYATKAMKKRITTDKENTKRLSTISYTLPIYEADNVVIRNIPVCKTIFYFLHTALEKLEKGQGAVQCDQRGKHVHHQKKITDDMKHSVLDHVASFSPVESHYIRKDSNKKYIDGSLSFPKMFRLYEEWFDSSKYTNKVSSVSQYRDIINSNINISFHKPKKDMYVKNVTYLKTINNTQNKRQKNQQSI
ncbi:hypothetical protein HW555_002917 [Spodoptera exigua]|uniref:Uncharacterized protein n=1 Tax=Spodoptera exigua TaxID=7107 RepID=A0A835L7G5_SPOEX|nr:hypothetical protein HW555_002917 [Spodoptera exigua]